MTHGNMGYLFMLFTAGIAAGFLKQVWFR